MYCQVELRVANSFYAAIWWCWRRAACDVLADIRFVDSTVSFGVAKHSEAHRPSLLAVPLRLGLADPRAHLLHGRHGAVQRRVQGQDGRRHCPAGCRQRRRRRLLRRRPPQLSHVLRHRFRWRHTGPACGADQLPEELVLYRPAVLSAVRHLQRAATGQLDRGIASSPNSIYSLVNVDPFTADPVSALHFAILV